MTTMDDIALERYGLRGAGLHQLRQGFVRVFHVVGSNREEFCLRMYDLPANGEHGSRPAPPPGRPSLEQLRAQLMWLSALARETALPVPELVSAVDGSLIAYASPEGEAQPHERGRQCVLQRWVPGTHKREKLGPTDASLVGSYVAGLHGHARRYALPDPSMLPRWDWHWALGESVPLWSEGEQFFSAREMAIFEFAARRVREDLQELGFGKDTFGPIHRDLHLSNILFHARRVGVIDFDLCGLGHYLLDLAVLLNGLRLSAHEPSGQVLSRQQILAAIWDFAFDPGSNVVDVYVSYLRNKIDRPGEPSLIQTVRGAGYRFEPSKGVHT